MKLDQFMTMAASLDIEEVKEAVNEFRPIITESVNLLLSFGPEFYKIAERVNFGVADLQAATFKRHMDNGFTREEAMRLIINTRDNYKEILSKVSNGKSK